MAKQKVDISKLLGAKPKIEIPKSKPKPKVEKAVSEIHVPKVSKPKKEKPKPEIPVRINLKLNKSTRLKFKMWCMENETTMTDEILKFIHSKI